MWVKSKASEYEEISKQIHIFAFYKGPMLARAYGSCPSRIELVAHTLSTFFVAY